MNDDGSDAIPDFGPDFGPEFGPDTNADLDAKPIELDFSDRERASVRFWLRLARIAKRVEGEVSARMLKTHGHRFTRFDVMSQLYREPDHTLAIGKLGGRLLTLTDNVSRLLDRMQADGLVARTRHPADRRQLLVTLTAQGRDQFQAMAKSHAQWVSEAFAELDDETLRDLEEKLREIPIGRTGSPAFVAAAE